MVTPLTSIDVVASSEYSRTRPAVGAHATPTSVRQLGATRDLFTGLERTRLDLAFLDQLRGEALTELPSYSPNVIVRFAYVEGGSGLP